MCEKVTHLLQLLTFLFLLMTSLFSQIPVLKMKIVFLYEPYPTNAKSLATSSGSLPVVFACFFLCLTKVFFIWETAVSFQPLFLALASLLSISHAHSILLSKALFCSPVSPLTLFLLQSYASIPQPLFTMSIICEWGTFEHCPLQMSVMYSALS